MDGFVFALAVLALVLFVGAVLANVLPDRLVDRVLSTLRMDR